NLGNPIDLVVQRDGKDVLTRITPRFNPPAGEGATGVEIGMANGVWAARVKSGMTTDEAAAKLGVPIEAYNALDRLGSDALGRTDWDTQQATANNTTPEQQAAADLAKLAALYGVSQDSLKSTSVHMEEKSLSPLQAIPAGIQRGGEMLVLFKNDI